MVDLGSHLLTILHMASIGSSHFHSHPFHNPQFQNQLTWMLGPAMTMDLYISTIGGAGKGHRQESFQTARTTLMRNKQAMFCITYHPDGMAVQILNH